VSAAQIAAFQANGGFPFSITASVLTSAVFATLLLWGTWAIRTAYIGWAEQRLNQRQLLGVVIRFTAMYLALAFVLLS
jgi:integrating conjugative element protein (TIGR03758 family)